MPLIIPPPPPQLEADKASVAQEFDKAEALLDQLRADTEELKIAEQKRVEAVDNALEEMHEIMADIKNKMEQRDIELRKLKEEIEIIRVSIPRVSTNPLQSHESPVI